MDRSELVLKRSFGRFIDGGNRLVRHEDVCVGLVSIEDNLVSLVLLVVLWLSNVNKIHYFSFPDLETLLTLTTDDFLAKNTGCGLGYRASTTYKTIQLLHTLGEVKANSFQCSSSTCTLCYFITDINIQILCYNQCPFNGCVFSILAEYSTGRSLRYLIQMQTVLLLVKVVLQYVNCKKTTRAELTWIAMSQELLKFKTNQTMQTI